MKVAKYIDDRIKDMLNNPHSTQGYPKTAQGNPCIVTDPSITPVGDMVVYGNSVQDGTPTPESPIEIQSVGDLVTDENDENYGKYHLPIQVNSQTINIYLDEPLKKVGDYVDYIDWENQKVVKNTMDIILKGTEDWAYSSTYLEFRVPISKLGAQSRLIALCNCYTTNLTRGTNNNVIVGMTNNYIFIGDNRFNTAEGFNNWLKSKYDAGDPVIITVGKHNYSSVKIDLPKLPIQPHFTNIISVGTATKGNLVVNHHSFYKEK